MDERKKTIRELEEKKQADIMARERLLEGLGEALLERAGENEAFTGSAGNVPGIVLADYRKLQKEIAESSETIKSLEQEILQLKALDEKISGKEKEKSGLEGELGEANAKLGQALLEDPEYIDTGGLMRQEEENLLAKIDKQETKLEELEERRGGLISWLGKNVQKAVSKTLISKNSSALKKVYRKVGEKFLSSGNEKDLEGEAAGFYENANKLMEYLSLKTTELNDLKDERKNTVSSYGTEGTPASRIKKLEKSIIRAKDEFPSVYLRFGSLLTENGGKEAMSSLLLKEDELVLEKAAALASQIVENDKNIKNIKIAINIDDEKTEIEKLKSAILKQQQKILAAEDVISDLEKQIAEAEQNIEELEASIQE